MTTTRESAGSGDRTEVETGVSRRGLMVGAGAAAVLGATVLGVGFANAEPAGPDLKKGSFGDKSDRVDATPVLPTIGSAPISGNNYRHASMLDFTADTAPTQRVYGGYGVHSGTAANYMVASLEIPAGALVRDIEWYVYNNSANPANALGRIWAAGNGSFINTLADVSIPVGTGITATRVVIPSASYGPHPLGTKVILALYTPVDGTVQVNGARVGFSRGVAAQGFLPAPVRAYDSRSTGGKLAAGATRAITLSSSIVRPGMTGVVINVAAVEGVGAGHLRVYPGNASLPSAASLNFASGATVTNQITVGVTSARQIKIYASRSVHVVVDVIGTFG